MTIIFTYEKAKKSLDLIFKKAALDGKVTIRKDDKLYVLTPASKDTSSLDVKGVDMGISTSEIIDFIHESRKQ